MKYNIFYIRNYKINFHFISNYLIILNKNELFIVNIFVYYINCIINSILKLI